MKSRAVARQAGVAFPESPEEEIPLSPLAFSEELRFHFSLQLLPEMAEMLAEYDQVCFIDTHTGSISESLRWEKVPAQYQNSPLSHHVTPATCLALASALYGKQPQSAFVSLRGHQFGFTRGLSPETQSLVPQAAQKILTWLRVGCNP